MHRISVEYVLQLLLAKILMGLFFFFLEDPLIHLSNSPHRSSIKELLPPSIYIVIFFISENKLCIFDQHGNLATGEAGEECAGPQAQKTFG